MDHEQAHPPPASRQKILIDLQGAAPPGPMPSVPSNSATLPRPGPGRAVALASDRLSPGRRRVWAPVPPLQARIEAEKGQVAAMCLLRRAAASPGSRVLAAASVNLQDTLFGVPSISVFSFRARVNPPGISLVMPRRLS